MAARLLSVNVGLPREITWRGQTVRTGIWKAPVQGRRIVRRRGSLAARDSQSPDMKEQNLPMSVKPCASGNKHQQITNQAGEKT
jgi:hypothetical protein